jgi:hypothetical protein
MPPINSLPADQRAVLELVLRRGRTYDEIAQLLSIDRAGVRQRALSALDALGPETDVPAERRALITDYLLGALPPRVADQVRARLAQNAAERAWARVIAAELGTISSKPLPEIPLEAGAVRPAPTPEPPAPEPPAPRERPVRRAPAAAPSSEETPPRRRSRRERREKPSRGLFGPRPPVEPGRERPSSRRGGKLVLTAAAIIVLVIVLSLALSGGSSKKTTSTGTTASTGATSTTGSTGGTGSTGATGGTGAAGAKVLAQINLKPPSGGSAVGIAELLQAGSTRAVAILAQHLAPNNGHDAYAVWLYNSSSDAVLLGFVSPQVGSSGQLRTEGSLPTNASHFHHLIVTLETTGKPKAPGKIELEGTLTGLS